MKIVFKSDDYQEHNFTREYEDGFGVNSTIGLRELKNTFSFSDMSSTTHRIYIPGVIVSLFEGNSSRELIRSIESDFPYLQMHFELTTTGCQYFPKGGGEPETHIYKGQHSLLFYPSLNGHLHYLAAQNSFSVEIELSIDFLNRIFNNDLGMLKQFGIAIEKNRPALMGNQSYPISSHMKNIIMEIKYCTYAGSLKKMFIEAKVIELLCMQIDQIMRAETKAVHIKREDIDKLYQVKETIENHLATPYSIEELSRMAGINRTKLQHGFKEIFGDTIFGYLTQSRMTQARELLLDGKYSSIAEVAVLCGYKNPQHFTAAFKKRYGYLPKEVKL